MDATIEIKRETKQVINFYKLKAGDLVYYGSTSKPLDERLRMHWYMLKSHHMGNYRRLTSFDLLESGKEVYLLPLLRKECTNQQRKEIEGNYIRKGKEDNDEKCVNIRIENRTAEERQQQKRILKMRITIDDTYE